jgi:3',5'-nucleoside bisphosphate phosphatase
MTRTKLLLFLAFLTAGLALPTHAELIRSRKPIRIPDIAGFKTLKCDFHTHTVFSDGNVWPHIRAEEAWREGLDAIAITDHLEYQPHKADLPTNHNRATDIAKNHGDALGLVVIRGSEITRKMPPGHLNAIFLSSSEELAVDDWRDSVKAASGQGAFIFWNHPGWTGQQSDGLARWYPEHDELLSQKMLHGMEVVNDQSYYPEVHRWCLEKNLTMLANSDVHDPIGHVWDASREESRPYTLVFASAATPEAIQEALFAGRTALRFRDLLIGREQYLRPIFEASVALLNPAVTVKGKGSVYVQVHNSSDVDYQLVAGQQFDEISVPARITLKAGRTVLLQVKGNSEKQDGKRTFDLRYTVRNLKTAADKSLQVTLPVEVTFVPTR